MTTTLYCSGFPERQARRVQRRGEGRGLGTSGTATTKYHQSVLPGRPERGGKSEEEGQNRVREKNFFFGGEGAATRRLNGTNLTSKEGRDGEEKGEREDGTGHGTWYCDY